MGIFSKIFVVLVAILSVFLIGLVVAFVTNVDTYKTKWMSAQTEAETARLNARLREADNLSMVQAAQSEVEQLQSQIAALNAKNNQQTQTVLSQQGRIVELEVVNVNVQTQLATLANAEKQHADINASLQEEIRNRRDRDLKLSTQNVELSLALNEKSTEASTLSRQVRLLQEQIADLEQQNQHLATGADARAGLSDARRSESAPLSPLSRGFTPDHPIRGMVTDLQQIGDGTFLTMNVGSNDGVREGMEFMIYKGDEFQANAVVLVVDLNSSAARVTILRGVIEPNKSEVLAGGTP